MCKDNKNEVAIKLDERYKHVRFTYHVPRENIIELGDQLASKLENTSFYVFGEEYGDKGETPHIQGYISLKKATMGSSLVKEYEGLYFLRCDKSANANINYCIKEGNKIWTSDQDRVDKCTKS